ncbi:MAG: endonuclease/exonuclease/phosphatase family protein [Halothece sp.]
MFLLNQRMKPLLTYVFSLGIVIVSLIAWLSSLYGWILPIELFSHFQVQYLIISLFLLFGLILVVGDKKFLFLAIFAVTITAINVLNWYFPLFSNQVVETPNVRVLVYNVNQHNENHEKALAMIRKTQANLAIFLEVNDIWIQKINQLNEEFSDFLYSSQLNNRGIAIYSQFPLENTSKNLYGKSDKPILSAEVTINRQRIHLIATHPAMPLNSFPDRNLELDQIATYLESLNQPVILGGDLNITMWSPYYRRLVNQTGLKNSREGFGILPTWPADNIHPIIANFLLIPIDHCLITSDIQVKRTYIGNNAGSDHFPLITDLFVPAT